MKNISLTNGDVKIVVDSRAGLQNLIVDGKERLFQNEKDIWPNASKQEQGFPKRQSDPILFPITGSLYKAKELLKDCSIGQNQYYYKGQVFEGEDPVYFYQGRIYSMTQHGFMRNMEMDVLDVAKDSCTLGLKSSSRTREMYPFDFEYMLTYSLLAGGISKRQEVINTGSDDMYFSIGNHTALATGMPISEYSLQFDADLVFENKLGIEVKTENGLLRLDETILPNFQTLVAKKNEANKCIMQCTDGSIIEYDVTSATLLIWTAANDDFICVEDWYGAPRALNDILASIKNGTLIKLTPEDKSFIDEKQLIFKN